ncbi:NAD(+) synthase [Citromicrobium bathyomarinum]|uniref:NAD(+) synthase n=1 Tax=Citromicrobium TaxID=72173 RepID=UPI0001DD0EA0|nr:MULTISPECIES: NAD(+) synthase [Citromicrobium]ALG61884.1 NAD synthetase [Citromicrobium sp. JL477]KPM18265.1 NAD synthetase [Citromicrobium sp. WPS32]|tara:strand:+ start:10867 stop:12939 length:2073 start_codon:yes stop_codon:yes gene_type:complete
MGQSAHPFFDLHTHGFVRVATCTPCVRPADVSGNAKSIVQIARDAHEAGVDFAVYPELCVTGYAIDDLHLQSAVIDAAETAVARIIEESAGLTPVLVIGAPVRRGSRLYNCALAISNGRLLGVVPKSYLPNYREFYEKRQFTRGHNCQGLDVTIAGHEAPFGTDVIFAADNLPGFVFGIEICEDFWAPQPPGMMAAMAGATILANLSASPVTIGRASDRHLHCASSSSRGMCAYAYSASGHGESTTDLAWDGQGVIYELGELMQESVRFDRGAELCVIDIDTQRIVNNRTQNGTFHDASEAAGRPEDWYRRVGFTHNMRAAETVGGWGLKRPVRRFPFVPDDPDTLHEDCYEAVNIQVDALMRRIEATRPKSLVLGISGGLDSTHALLVACVACDRLGLPRETIRGYTMPGFGTSDRTKDNALKLMDAAGITAETIDIVPAAQLMLKDIGHPFADGKEVYDTTFENVQAGLRTDYLFRLAGHHGGFVIGTGDLSELALGWCTYGVGDQMSHYGVNSGVPKTLIQYLMRWMIETDQFSHDLNEVLEDVLGTEISPELVPAGADGAIQSTEDHIGPYALHDFFLHHIARHGQSPSHVAFLAWHAWKDAESGKWPLGFPDEAKQAYDLATIRKWLAVFCRRFFGFSQFKRSAMPNGPKVSMGGALSPRGDWRAPSDAVADLWLAEIEANIPES